MALFGPFKECHQEEVPYGLVLPGSLKERQLILWPPIQCKADRPGASLELFIPPQCTFIGGPEGTVEEHLPINLTGCGQLPPLGSPARSRGILSPLGRTSTQAG